MGCGNSLKVRFHHPQLSLADECSLAKPWKSDSQSEGRKKASKSDWRTAWSGLHVIYIYIYIHMYLGIYRYTYIIKRIKSQFMYHMSGETNHHGTVPANHEFLTKRRVWEPFFLVNRNEWQCVNYLLWCFCLWNSGIREDKTCALSEALCVVKQSKFSFLQR